tara:strand:- start:407 stop:652 length:246 start_codon:yes stop_codon:yes gene_type:complete
MKASSCVVLSDPCGPVFVGPVLFEPVFFWWPCAAEEDADVTFLGPLLDAVGDGRLSEQTAGSDATQIPATMADFWRPSDNV